MIPFVSIAQDKLTKNEIYSIWCYNVENRSIINTNFDSSVVVLVDSLEFFLKVDTIGIFEEYSASCFILTSEGMKSISPWTAYIQWIKNGKNYYQKVNKHKAFKIKEIEDSKLITFYINNKDSINLNRIMPIITAASLNEKGQFRFSTQTSTDFSIYTIYCELHGNSVIKNYTDYRIIIEDDLFYMENKKSIIKKWKEVIENQIGEIDKE